MKPGQLSNILLKVFAYLCFIGGIYMSYLFYQDYLAIVSYEKRLSLDVAQQMIYYSGFSLMAGILLFCLLSVVSSIYDKVYEL